MSLKRVMLTMAELVVMSINSLIFLFYFILTMADVKDR